MILATFLRLYQLGNIPHGFYQDESAIGYNAYSLLRTGKDEWGVTWPLYVKSFGDYKLPVYVYATIPSIMLFGVNEFSVRFPSAFFGILTVGVVYFLTKKLTENIPVSFITMGLLAINPWSLHYNRATFEVSICLFLFTIGTLLLLHAFTSRKRGFFFLGTLSFLLSLYAYNLTRLLSPVVYGLVLLYGWKTKHALSKRELFTTSAIAIVALIPFINTFFSQGGVASARGTLLFSSAVVKAPWVEFKSYIAVMPFLGKIFAMPVLLMWQYILNIVSYFSVQFFFLTGSTHGNHGIGNVGQLYLFELPFLLVGIVMVVRQRKHWGLLVGGWAIFTILVASLTRDVPHATRSFFLIFPLEIFSAYGAFTVVQYLRVKKRLMQIVGSGIFILFVVFNLVYYFTSYYVRFPVLYAKQWRLEDKDVALFLQNNEKQYEKIIFDKKAGFIYTSLLFFNSYSPEEFQKTEKREKEDAEGFSMVTAFGKYQFRDLHWVDDYHKGNLIITTPDKVPPNVLPIKSFVYPRRPIAFALNQEIVSYPVDEVAYVAVEGR